MDTGTPFAPRLRAVGVALALLAATVAVCGPLIRERGLPAGSDVLFAAQSSHGFTRALSEGVVYPRWIDEGNRGLGSPTFVFYPPLAYYAAAACSWIAGGTVPGLRLAVTLLVLLSGCSFYLAARSRFSPLASLAGAVLYVALPYHVFDVYDRFALAELAAFVLLPPLVPLLRRMTRRPAWGPWSALALCWGLLLLTHALSGFMALCGLAPLALCWLGLSPGWRRVGALVAAGGAAALLAAVYLLPVAAHRERVHLDCVTGGSDSPFCRKFDWRINFLDHGVTPDTGSERDVKPALRASALGQALLAAAAAIVLALALRGNEPIRGLRREALGHGAVALASLLLQSVVSWPLWAVLPGMAHVQFPWRFGIVQALSAALLVCCAVAALASLPRSRVAAGSTLLVLAALPALGVAYAQRRATPFTFTPAVAADPRVREVTYYEYLPREVRWDAYESFPVGRDAPRAWLASAGAVETVSWASQRRLLRVETDTDNRVTVATFAFPGWVARLDGQRVALTRADPYAAIEVAVPPGRHLLELRFERTADRKVGAAISALAAAGLLLAGLRARWRGDA